MSEHVNPFDELEEDLLVDPSCLMESCDNDAGLYFINFTDGKRSGRVTVCKDCWEHSLTNRVKPDILTLDDRLIVKLLKWREADESPDANMA